MNGNGGKVRDTVVLSHFLFTFQMTNKKGSKSAAVTIKEIEVNRQCQDPLKVIVNWSCDKGSLSVVYIENNRRLNIEQKVSKQPDPQNPLTTPLFPIIIIMQYPVWTFTIV